MKGWHSCPFCGTKGLTSKYTLQGTELYCGGYGRMHEGCHGVFIFPAFEKEVLAMWNRTQRKKRKAVKHD